MNSNENENVNMNANMKIETIHPCPIAYVRQTGAYGKDNIRAMEQLKQWARNNGLMNGKTVIFGIPQDNPQITAPEYCRYDACIALVEEPLGAKEAEYSKHVPADDTTSAKQIPAGGTTPSKQIPSGDTMHSQQASEDSKVQYGELPGGTYAVFTVSHTAEAVAQAWIEIFALISASGSIPDLSRPILERYHAGLVAEHLCEICVPITEERRRIK
ncbi:MAG: gyrase inhibitor [Bacillota bacterium]|jgi:DNA gyrase inhibitor GyrI|nr:gyrase inhibitor [Bacillota bacterium]